MNYESMPFGGMINVTERKLIAVLFLVLILGIGLGYGFGFVSGIKFIIKQGLNILQIDNLDELVSRAYQLYTGFGNGL